MRHRALILCTLVLLLLPLVAGCNSTGVPDPISSTATPGARPTATDVAIVDPVPVSTPTAAPRPNTPTTEPLATETVEPQATGTQQPQATETPAAADTPAPSGTVSAELMQEVDQIEKDQAKFRGLEPLADVPEAFLTDEQLRANLTKDQEEQYPRDKAARDAKEIWLMRLSDDPNLDIYQLELDLLTEVVLGYYDPLKDELFVRRGSSAELSPLARSTLAHEYTHVLQDQHYDLNKLQPEHTTDGDKALAIHSLIEGDAEVSGLLYAKNFMTPEDFQSVIDSMSSGDTTVLDSAPRYIRESLYFPYTTGVDFVIALGILDGFGPIDQAFANPPVSTEQIMHPEKYMSAKPDLPKPAALVPLTDTLGAGWIHGDNGTIGEFDLKILLEENGAVDGEGAAAGWGGGTYEYYANGDNFLMMINTAWDTKRDADEFEDGINETFASYDKAGIILKDPDGKRFFSVKRVGDKITLGASTDSAALQRAMGAIK